MKAPMYTITNESISVIHEGKYYTVRHNSPNFDRLKKAILSENWDDAIKNLTVTKSIVDWAKGNFSVVDGLILYKGKKLPDALNDRIFAMVTAGDDPGALFNFWEKLQKNPSMRSVEQLWSFLNHQGIPITKDGNILAYKSVTSDFKDHHTKTVDNTVGTENEMPRNEISDDPNFACHKGFHVGAIEYAETFGGCDSHIVICEVNPEHVVCIPYDHSAMKMRVCKYRVVGLYATTLSSTVHNERLPVDCDCDLEDEWEYDEEIFDEEESDFAEYEEDEEKLSYDQFDSLSKGELLNQTTKDLRMYAHRICGIVGASRIQGGKEALVDAIMKTRRSNRGK